MDQQLKFSTQYSYRIKLLVLGAKQSGKSSLIYTYKHDNPPSHKISSQQTDAIIKKIRYIKTNKQGSQKQHFQCNIHLWDTTAQQSPDILNNILLKRVNAIILVFDLHSRNSFQRMRAIWSKIQQQRKQLYHVQVIMVGNVKQKALSNQIQEKQFGTVEKDRFGSIRRKKNYQFDQDQIFRAQRSDIVQEDFNPRHSVYRMNSYRKATQQYPQDFQDFSNQIKAFKQSQDCQYQTISVHNPQQVRQVFQKLLGKIMKNIQQGKINLHDTIIKDTQGKIKLRKFDFKTYEYFQKRYNRCC